MSLLAAENLHVSYGGAAVLEGVSVAIEPGEIVTLVGPNGSGKSTLVKAMLGVISPDRGQVVRSRGLRIGYVPQRLHIDANLPMTVARFLSLPTRQSDASVSAALDRVGVPGLENRQMTALSGGQFQRVLLARALLTDPQILVLDEPTQGLDQPGEAAFYELLEAVRRETGVAVFMVSHDLHVVMSASDRVVCLNRHICCQGTPKVVSAAPEYRALFGHGTHGALALYQHDHDHSHDHDHGPAQADYHGGGHA
ncbi:metal ABC transporter ATP-binding protein [Maritimibacter sp. HL-12]|uniref:metal ABC transporter ATP-binding protein n=1 Tax=Maritimibacter sp. HL-12 TaxID=1162418 RepID=UPI000A0F26A9|nr:metal ABC transporter ATP-binding protein [Maritimibacter sp. HL-12]SMH53217.1 zinc transport system ATP-binding protein [Maritimibacter sp. HL-12]